VKTYLFGCYMAGYTSTQFYRIEGEDVEEAFQKLLKISHPSRIESVWESKDHEKFNERL
jgi:hypothetical protein